MNATLPFDAEAGTYEVQRGTVANIPGLTGGGDTGSAGGSTLNTPRTSSEGAAASVTGATGSGEDVVLNDAGKRVFGGAAKAVLAKRARIAAAES